jgi:hypothetical protein
MHDCRLHGGRTEEIAIPRAKALLPLTYPPFCMACGMIAARRRGVQIWSV